MNAYSLQLPSFVNLHFGSATALVRDRADPRDPKLDAYVRSGDYFILLATMLDNLASELPETSVVSASLTLSRLADELLYVQKHYHIVPKRRADPTAEL
jgi:hypothetical protein